MADFDLAIVGGGINGAGLARDAAGRGIEVLLIEQNDLGSGTSSGSTKLIHGGLRYLQHYEFALVRKALREREILLRMAPHLIRPMRFVLPHHDAMRPAWMLRLGLFLYDHLGGSSRLPGTCVLDLSGDPAGIPLKRILKLGFEYSDCWVDDSRLVILNALDAAERGAVIRTRTRLVRAEREGECWRLVLNACGQREVMTARVLVNAAGPWIAPVAQTVIRAHAPARIRLVKGSHIVVPRLFEHDRAYIFQNVDDRVVFAIPFEDDFTLIGTTDQDYEGDPSGAAATPAEITYLCQAVTRYLRNPVTPYEVVHAYAAVRPLYDDGAARASDLTRDYVLDFDAEGDTPPLLTIVGGKITTYRRLAEDVLAKIGQYFAAGAPWTAQEPLPGGNLPSGSIDRMIERVREKWPFLTANEARRLARAYGTRIDDVLGRAQTRDEAGPWFGGELSAAEVRYLVHQEWAQTPEDVLWRRTKFGLRFGADERNALAQYMKAQTAAQLPVE